MPDRSLFRLFALASVVESSFDARAPKRLYHGTTVRRVTSILADNTVNGSETPEGEMGVFVTMSFDNAAACGDRRATRETAKLSQTLSTQPPDQPHGVVLELDGALLADNFEVRKYHWDEAPEKGEWIVMGDLWVVRKYLVAIHLHDTDVLWHETIVADDPEQWERTHALITNPLSIHL